MYLDHGSTAGTEGSQNLNWVYLGLKAATLLCSQYELRLSQAFVSRGGCGGSTRQAPATGVCKEGSGPPFTTSRPRHDP